VDSVTANRELRGIVQLGLIELRSTRRRAYSTLNVPSEVKVSQPVQTDEEKILVYVRNHGSINNAECRNLLHVGMQHAYHLLKKMHMRGSLVREGEYRWARYRLP